MTCVGIDQHIFQAFNIEGFRFSSSQQTVHIRDTNPAAGLFRQRSGICGSSLMTSWLLFPLPVDTHNYNSIHFSIDQRIAGMVNKTFFKNVL